MADSRPIGLLDSGVGGLGVLREVRRLLPHESFIYFADEAHMPYGPRPRDEIRGFVADIVRFLLDHNCKMIVIPCNAANAAALHWLREQHPTLPIVGMEPAIKPAAEATRSGVIGVITTQVTFQGELFASVIDRFARDVQVETQVCPDFVLLVEQGAPDTPASHAVIANYLAPLVAAGIDQLVIGCTHFTFLHNQLQSYLGDGVTIVDPAAAVARQTARLLAAHDLAADSKVDGDTQYFSSGAPAHLRDLVATLLGEIDAPVQLAEMAQG
jgi:glutamate racemase